MQVVLQGSLRRFPVAELLTFLCRGGQSGTLDIEATGRKTRILFEGPVILWAESNKTNDAFESVLDAFEWTAGTFTVLDSAALPENAKPANIALQTALDESKKRAEARALYADATQFRLVDDPAVQAQVSLRGDEFKILFRLSSTGKTFRELVMDFGVPRPEIAERLKKLVTLGLVEVVRDEEPVTQQQVEAAVTAPQKKMTFARKRTLVGSLTPDHKPDSVYPLLDAESSIGRANENSIAITDGSVSSKHARILRTEEGFVLEDLQSRNGTFVNGEKLDAPRLLTDGDLIRVGKVMMTFNIAREAKPGEATDPEVRLA